jgi:hypothetical protein
MDEISSSPEVRETFQAAIDVVDAGYRVLRSPGAEKRLGGDYTALQATLRSLEIALANHARAAEKTPSQAFAPSSASTPASFPRSPLLGVAIADDVVILVILLFAAAAVAVTAGQAGKPPPKITHQDVFKPLESILALAVGLSVPEARKLHQLIKDIIEKIKECMDKHPDRLGACADFIATFNDVSSTLLKRLTTFIYSMGTLGPTGVVQIVRAIEALRKDFVKVLASLIDCLGCDNIK